MILLKLPILWPPWLAADGSGSHDVDEGRVGRNWYDSIGRQSRLSELKTRVNPNVS